MRMHRLNRKSATTAFSCVWSTIPSNAGTLFISRRATAPQAAGWPCFTSDLRNSSTGCPWRRKCARRLAKKRRSFLRNTLQRSGVDRRNPHTVSPGEAVETILALIEEEPRISIWCWGGSTKKSRTAGIVDRWQDVHEVSHPDHYRSRQSEPGQLYADLTVV